MNKYIKERIKQLKEQLSSPECNNPIKVEHKLEAYNEMQQQLKNCNLQNVNASTSIECTDGEHHFYEVYFVNSDKEPFELDCIKCLECGKIDTDI